MNKSAVPGDQGSSTRPYLIRALHDWCTDNGFTPYIAVYVDATVQVPMEYVKNSEIVLNIGFEATSGLKLGNDFVEFRARFGGISRDILVPVDHVVAIYARENGQGMAFPAPVAAEAAARGAPSADGHTKASLRLARTEDEAAAPPEPALARSTLMGLEDTQPDDGPPPPAAPGGGRPTLKRIK